MTIKDIEILSGITFADLNAIKYLGDSINPIMIEGASMANVNYITTGLQ